MKAPPILAQARAALRVLMSRAPKSSSAAIRAADALRWLDQTQTAGAPSFCIRVRFNVRDQAWEGQILMGAAGGFAPNLPLASWDLETGLLVSNI